MKSFKPTLWMNMGSLHRAPTCRAKNKILRVLRLLSLLRFHKKSLGTHGVKYCLIHARAYDHIREQKRFKKWLLKEQAIVVITTYFHYVTLDYFTNKNGHMIANTIYRFENLQNETNQLLERLDFRVTQLPKQNSNIKENYKAPYTSNNIENVASGCKRNIEYFNYEF